MSEERLPIRWGVDVSSGCTRTAASRFRLEVLRSLETGFTADARCRRRSLIREDAQHIIAANAGSRFQLIEKSQVVLRHRSSVAEPCTSGGRTTQMPYGFIPLISSIALTAVYIFVTEASPWSKALVAGLLLVSLVWHYGLFLQVALSVLLLLYFTCLKSRA